MRSRSWACCSHNAVSHEGDAGRALAHHQRTHPRLDSTHRTAGLSEALNALQLQTGTVVTGARRPGHDIARLQPQGQLVRVVQNDGLVGYQTVC